MSNYPKTLFRPGGPEIFYGRSYERCIVNTADEEQERTAQNWLPRPLEAPEPEPEPKAPKPKSAAKAKAPKAAPAKKAKRK